MSSEIQSLLVDFVRTFSNCSCSLNSSQKVEGKCSTSDSPYSKSLFWDDDKRTSEVFFHQKSVSIFIFGSTELQQRLHKQGKQKLAEADRQALRLLRAQAWQRSDPHESLLRSESCLHLGMQIHYHLPSSTPLSPSSPCLPSSQPPPH